MKEVWKDVLGFEEAYQVSNYGRIKRKKRTDSNNRTHKERIMSPSMYSNGYMNVELRMNNKKRRTSEHRLVAEAFIDNPLNLPQINHKDENKANNHVSNLEWCTAQYNIRYKDGVKRRRATAILNSNAVCKYSMEGEFIEKFECATDAAISVNGSCTEILSCCHHRAHSLSYKGYMWRFLSECKCNKIEPYEIKKSSLCRKVGQYTLDGDFIQYFYSVQKAAESVNARPSNIRRCCLGKIKSCMGFKWRFSD